MLLKAAELDLEYGIKGDFLRALANLYGLKQFGLGEPLYSRAEVEQRLHDHADDGRPSVQTMTKRAKAIEKAKQEDG